MTLSVPRLALLAIALFAGATAASASCLDIHFARGTSSTVITGQAPVDGTLCYAIATGPRQTAHLQITQGDNTVFSVDGLADARDDFVFTTQQRIYHILVGQLMRTLTPENFALGIEIK